MKLTPIKDLSGDAIDLKPRNMDWSEGYPEKWEYYEHSRCEECGELVFCGSNGDSHRALDGTDCDGHVPTTEGPMMNYFYPLPTFSRNSDTAGEASREIADLPLCLIRLEQEDEWGLALTGGGMDLSWEICEAYMRLGYVPPFHFTDLPEYGDRGASALDKWIVRGCRCSAKIMAQRAKWRIRKLIRVKKGAAA